MPALPRPLSGAATDLRVWARDYGYALRGQAAAILRRPDPAAWHRAGAPAVVLIPGIYESWAFLRPVAEALHEHGWDVHVAAQLRYNTGTIEEMARLVDRHIRDERLERCLLVAHSKGGLIGKHLLAHHNERTVIGGLVAVNTPFTGSALARLLPLPAIRVFLPHSPELTALTARREVDRRIVSIYGAFDPHIPGGSRLEGARNVQLDTRGHFLPLGDPAVHRAILEALRELHGDPRSWPRAKHADKLGPSGSCPRQDENPQEEIPVPDKPNPIDLQKALGGLDYPVSKDDIVKKAEDSGAGDAILKVLRDLPDQTFEKPTHVTEAVFDR